MEFRAILIFMVSGSFSVFFLSLMAGCANQPSGIDLRDLPSETRQVLQVTTGSWDASSGSLQRWERSGSAKWSMAGEAIPVVVGKAGLAPGRGLNAVIESVPGKKEGDMKAPAGVFSLGPAFGYAENPPEGCHFPYRSATEHDFFVDDVDAPEYNQWINLPGGLPEAESRWKSFEKMRREDDLYELGVVVNHNMEPPVPGSGSAIFLHIWSGPGQPTSGCTAMSRPDMVELLSWLEAEDHPVLIQVPEGIF